MTTRMPVDAEHGFDPRIYGNKTYAVIAAAGSAGGGPKGAADSFLPSTPLASEKNAGSGQHSPINLRPTAKGAAIGPTVADAISDRSISVASVADTAEGPHTPSLAATSADSLAGDRPYSSSLAPIPGLCCLNQLGEDQYGCAHDVDHCAISIQSACPVSLLRVLARLLFCSDAPLHACMSNCRGAAQMLRCRCQGVWGPSGWRALCRCWSAAATSQS